MEILIEAINTRAAPESWQLVAVGFDNTTNALGMANWQIRSTDAATHPTDRDATVHVVEQAWAESPLHVETLDFMKAHAPEAYVRAIYAAHQTPLAT